MLLGWFCGPKPLSQKQRSTLFLLHKTAYTPSFGGFRLSSWRLSLYSKADGWEYLASGYVRLNQVSGGLNSMIVRAEDGLVKVFVNGARVHSQAVSTAIYRGDVAVAMGVRRDSEREGAVTRVTRFTIDAL